MSTDRQTDTDRPTDRQTDKRHAKNDSLEISMPQKVHFHQNLEIDFSDQCNTFSILRIAEKVERSATLFLYQFFCNTPLRLVLLAYSATITTTTFAATTAIINTTAVTIVTASADFLQLLFPPLLILLKVLHLPKKSISRF